MLSAFSGLLSCDNHFHGFGILQLAVLSFIIFFFFEGGVGQGIGARFLGAPEVKTLVFWASDFAPEPST